MPKNDYDTKKNGFSRLLLKWNNEKNTRQMPWKGEKDPYKIWLSEIILQQTRVEQGLKYYNNFINAFPDVHKLANASDQKVFKYWEGLGYYSRCRNLIDSARYISKKLKGKFPDSYIAIKDLKGIGPYTAAAISSFAFNLPFAVLDGNVFRVLARYFGIGKPIDSTSGKKQFAVLAHELLDKKHPGVYNQAIMDFGAVICKPTAPGCITCILKKDCSAFRKNLVSTLPVKEKKTRITKRWFYYLLLEYKNKSGNCLVAIRKRTGKDIWKGLYEFPLLEAAKEMDIIEIIKEAANLKWVHKKEYELLEVSPVLRQQLSHQLIAGQIIRIKINQKPLFYNEYTWVTPKKMKSYAFPQFINQFGRYNEQEQK